MLASLKQLSHIDGNADPAAADPDEPLLFDDLNKPTLTASCVAAIFGFLCFIPYPAYPIGNNTALQMGNVATVFALLFASMRLWEQMPLSMLFLVLTPRCVSTLKVLLIDGADASLCFKATGSWAITLLTVIAVQIHAPRHALSFLTGIALATLLHVAIGVYQVYSFASGVFPLAELYENVSFLSVQENALKMARWEQRPFGLFPEPSAMASCLGPFVIYFAAICFRLVHLRQRPTYWHRYLFAAASAGGMALMIASRSGHSAPTLAALAILFLWWLGRAPGDLRTYAIVSALMGIAMPVAFVFAYQALLARLSGGTDLGNDSWEERYTSLVIGFKAWSQQGLATALFGLGPGLSTDVVKSASGIDSVFSLLLAYFYDTGVIGLVAISWVGRRVWQSWRDSRFNLVFGLVLVNWAIGVTVTTSYGQLLPLWITLGWLSSWDAICEIDVAPSRAAVVRIPLPLSLGRRRRVSPWSLPPAMDGNAIDGAGEAVPT
jgi:hypothetical protein